MKIEKTKISVIVLFAIITISMFQNVYAMSVTHTTNTGSTSNDIADSLNYDGTRIYVGTQNAIKYYDTNYNLLGSLSATNPDTTLINTNTNRIYFVTGASSNSLWELDTTGFFADRTVTIGSTSGIFMYNSTHIVSSDATNRDVELINLNTFTKTDGTAYSLANCTGAQLLDIQSNKAIMYCTSPSTFMMVTPASGIFSATTGSRINVGLNIQDAMFISSTNMLFYVLDNSGTGTGSIGRVHWNGTGWDNNTILFTSSTSADSFSGMFRDYTNNKAYVISSIGTLYVIDTSTSAITSLDLSIALASCTQSHSPIAIKRDSLGILHGTNGLYITTAHNCWIDINLSGIIPPSNTGGVDCSQLANANILICRLVGTTGGNIGGTSGIIGNGLTNLFVNSGLISSSNTDVKTNGIGYIVTGIALGIMIAVFWIASKGQLREIPTFVWFLGTLAVLGSMTAIQWIDPTFLIIGVIGIVALAVAKTKSSIFGDSFGSGGFSGE